MKRAKRVIKESEEVFYSEIIPDTMEQDIKSWQEHNLKRNQDIRRELNDERRHQELLEMLENSKIDSPVNQKIYFDENVLITGNKQYKTRGFRLDLLKFLLITKRAKPKEWSVDKLIDALEGEVPYNPDDCQKFSDKLYSACYGINQQLGIDLLIFTKSFVKLNSKHL